MSTLNQLTPTCIAKSHRITVIQLLIRLWQAFHDTITHNHQCRSIWLPLKKVRHFIETASPFSESKHGLVKMLRYWGVFSPPSG
ncbi:hypothetical protein GL115_23880 [Escherichia coli]|nr:hypothetical protein [Escherichia coli]